MRRFILTIVASFSVATIVNAQYAVGDIFEKDEVKAVVFYVDDTGEHGLAITLGRYEYSQIMSANNRKNLRAQITDGEKNLTDQERKLSKADKKKRTEKIREYYVDLAELTTDDGKKNADIIKAYCMENNIDMSIYFPAQYWAESLGEGWFVPGEREAILYSNYIANGVGKSAYKGINKKTDLLKKYEEINNALRSNSGYEELALYDHINTSTIGSNKFMFKDFYGYKSLEPRAEARKMTFGASMIWYYDIDTYYQAGSKIVDWINQQKVAVYEF